MQGMLPTEEEKMLSVRRALAAREKSRQVTDLAHKYQGDMRAVMQHVQREEQQLRETAAAEADETAVPSTTPEKPAEPEEEEVPKCHLHRKPNKACRFCKAFLAHQEMKSKKEEDKKNEALKRLKKPRDDRSGKGWDSEAKPAIPNLVYFPHTLKERILLSKSFNIHLNEIKDHDEIKDVLRECDSCDTDVRKKDMDFAPSTFIMSIYKMLNMKLTEGELYGLLNNGNKIVRCAGYLYVRLGIHQDRYWELLSAALMDDEQFKPFAQRDAENWTVGEYVEKLLALDKYCDIALPRVGVTMRKTFTERLAMYGQFRQRYKQNLEVLNRYEAEGVPVEVCGVDGEWVAAETVGGKKYGRRCVQVPVKFSDGTEQSVSIGMLITTEDGPYQWTADANEDSTMDLTKSRGRSNKELLDECRQQHREAMVTGNKDYCRGTGVRTVHAGGVTFFAGPAGRKKKRQDKSDSSDDEKYADQAKRRKEDSEREQQKLEIMQKYCVSSVAARGKSAASGAGDVEGPDRMRLG